MTNIIRLLLSGIGYQSLFALLSFRTGSGERKKIYGKTNDINIFVARRHKVANRNMGGGCYDGLAH